MFIDLSEYNSVASFKTLAQNVEGIFLRLGYRGYGKSGTLKLDAKFLKYQRRCEEEGIPYGVYFITTAINKAEGEEEAQFCLDTIAGLTDKTHLTLGVWIDTEPTGSPTHTGRSDALNKKDRTDAVLGFVDYIEARKEHAGIYASESWFYDKLEYGRTIPYNKWVADWYTTPSLTFEYWQYSSKEKVEGMLSARVDCSMKASEIEHYDFNLRCPELHKGLKLEAVKLWQAIVGVKADGSFGKETDKATRAWQKEHGLRESGIVDKDTWSKALRGFIL